MKKKYNESLNLKNRKLDFEDDITELHPKKRGRPLLVGAKLDTKVQKCVTVLRDNGAVIKSQIVIAAAKGIIIGNDKILLPIFGFSSSKTRCTSFSFHALYFRLHLGTFLYSFSPLMQVHAENNIFQCRHDLSVNKQYIFLS
jgi:hypothetical protein